MSFTRIFCRIPVFLGIVCFGFQVHALGLIRDAEIEDTLRSFATPVFEAAGVTPDAVHIFIVNNPEINAFVAGGSNLFLHTGLILATDEPSMLIGVIAHETGHIAGGHLISGMEKLKNAQIGTILSTILGAALIVGGGRDVGPAVIAGGQEFAKRGFLANSRTNENTADQAALTYLDSIGMSAHGMLRMFEKLRMNENRRYGRPDPYVMTHPLSTDRITNIRNHVMRSSIPKDQLPANTMERYNRMVAKLRGFLQEPSQTLNYYKAKDQSIPARYARSVAYFRQADLKNALKEIDSLIAQSPNDAYFHELKGQFLFENGQVQAASQSYLRAVQLKPASPLILANYAQTLIAQQNPATLQEAVKYLEKSTSIDPTNTMAWEQLVIAYGRQNNLGRSYLAKAEIAALVGDAKGVRRNVVLAQKSLPKDGPARLRSEDLKRLADKIDEDKKDSN